MAKGGEGGGAQVPAGILWISAPCHSSNQHESTISSWPGHDVF